MPPGDVHDTRLISKQACPGKLTHNLDDTSRRLQFDVGRGHRSSDGVIYTARAFLNLKERLATRG